MKKLLGTLVTTAMAAMPFAVVACSSSTPSVVKDFDYDQVSKSVSAGNWDFQSQDWSMENIDWSKIPHVDAEINHWIDGDTPHVHFLENFAGRSKTDDVGIRIAGIDTPELHVQGADGKINVETTGNELAWATKGKEFGEKEMPVGTKIRIATPGDKSYTRVVGSIFYGKNFEKSYSVEIMKKGLCYPFLGTKVSSITSENSIMRYVALPIADAYNKAKNNKVGIFSPNAGDVSIIHGTTDISTVQWEHHTQLTGNIYNIVKNWSLFK